MVLRALKLNKLITDRVVNKKHENVAPGNLERMMKICSAAT
jgi:hypothetical protein